MTKKPILFVDMDGVVADFMGAVVELATHPERLYNEKTRSTEIDQTCLKNPLIFQFLNTIEGSTESIKLLSKYYSIYFLSTPMWILPESYTSKRIWLEKIFGKFAHKRLILTHRKDLITSSKVKTYLIDDRTVNGAGDFEGTFIHFGYGEFKNWKLITKFLLNERGMHI